MSISTTVQSPWTITNDSSIGSISWNNVWNVSSENWVTSDSNNFWVSSTQDWGIYDSSIKLVVWWVVVWTNQSTWTAFPYNSSLAYATYWGNTNLWWLSLSSSDINNSQFWVVFSVQDKIMSTWLPSVYSNYIKATNFNFSIPTGAVIDWIKVEVKRTEPSATYQNFFATVDHIRMTVYYTQWKNIKALVVAWWGWGWGGYYWAGGGAGQFIYNASLAVSAQQYSVTVGTWGVGGAYMAGPGRNGVSGNNSIFSSITALWGWYGGSDSYSDPNTGSGWDCPTTYGRVARAYGWNSPGGSGAGGLGTTGANYIGGNGGVGASCDISGSTVYYSGGGGWGWANVRGTGGNRGGGDGGGNYGTANTGGWGGGSWYNVNGGVGWTGGSGIVILRWTTTDFGTCSLTGTWNTITTNWADSIATFIVSGNITFTAAAATANASFFYLMV